MSQISNFDPQAFLDVTMEESLEKREILPVGDYTAVIGEVASRAWQGKKDPTMSGIAWDIPLTLDIPVELQANLGLPSTLNLKDSIMLDLTESGTIDTGKGKNGRLRMYREATNMNQPGQAFSARKLQGQVITVKIGHDIWNDAPIEKVVGVAKSA